MTTSKATKRTENQQAWIDAHPVRQSFHTGKWGFARICDCLDLSECVYPSRKSAEMARALASVYHV